MTKPQQPELRRSERGQTDQEQWARHEEARGPRNPKGRHAPVPEENQPGHHPDREQDKPEGAPGAD